RVLPRRRLHGENADIRPLALNGNVGGRATTGAESAEQEEEGRQIDRVRLPAVIPGGQAREVEGVAAPDLAELFGIEGPATDGERFDEHLARELIRSGATQEQRQLV